MDQERSIVLFSSEISKELKMGFLMGKQSEDNSEVLKMGYSWASKESTFHSMLESETS
jgi:hypothetical protein